MVTTTPPENILVSTPTDLDDTPAVLVTTHGDLEDAPSQQNGMVLVAHAYSNSEVVDGEGIPVHMSTMSGKQRVYKIFFSAPLWNLRVFIPFFSDPMLNSETENLLCASDHENDKVNDD